MPKSNQEKNLKIKQTKAETKQRRGGLILKTRVLKFDSSALTKNAYIYLNRLFAEAKWLTNHMIAISDNKQENSKSIFDFDDKTSKVFVKNQDTIKERVINSLSSQMKQSLVDRKKQDISNLFKSKKKGNKIGALKFKSEINSIPLKQFGSTFRLDEKHINNKLNNGIKWEKINNSYIYLQGHKQRFKVMGLSQISQDAEWASALLVRKGGDFFLHITTYERPKPKTKKEIKQENNKPIRIIGTDFGIGTSLTFSNGEEENFNFIESKLIKKWQKIIARKDRKGKPIRFDGKKNKQEKNKKGISSKSKSKNRYKAKLKLGKAYIKLTNKKEDTKNKFLHKIRKENNIIAYQDESIKAWHHGLFGKQVQHSILGGIKEGLSSNPSTSIMVDKWFPSTQKCLKCDKLNKIPLSQQTYNCDDCEYVMPRNTHSALNMVVEAIINPKYNFGNQFQLRAGRTDVKPLEIETPDIKTAELLQNKLDGFNVKFLVNERGSQRA